MISVLAILRSQIHDNLSVPTGQTLSFSCHRLNFFQDAATRNDLV